ncbi:hypothetical protein FGB62_161g04 [Gracilaria domingensis]|nr:hypothetical protein FGB62_161g04 [Gracilaria domingensis]
MPRALGERLSARQRYEAGTPRTRSARTCGASCRAALATATAELLVVASAAGAGAAMALDHRATAVAHIQQQEPVLAEA